MVAKLNDGHITTLADAAQLVTKTLKQGNRIYICGNGGSAADAQHIAGELVGRFDHDRKRKALPAVALTTDTSILTAVSNDYGYNSVFTRQVEALVEEGDLLWAISTSGSSENIIAAARLAKKKRASVLTFTGKADSKLEQIADICFCAQAQTSYRCQEIHQLGYHIICDIVDQNFCE